MDENLLPVLIWKGHRQGSVNGLGKNLASLRRRVESVEASIDRKIARLAVAQGTKRSHAKRKCSARKQIGRGGASSDPLTETRLESSPDPRGRAGIVAHVSKSVGLN
jgi:hypothetical protein